MNRFFGRHQQSLHSTKLISRETACNGQNSIGVLIRRASESIRRALSRQAASLASSSRPVNRFSKWQAPRRVTDQQRESKEDKAAHQPSAVHLHTGRPEQLWKRFVVVGELHYIAPRISSAVWLHVWMHGCGSAGVCLHYASCRVHRSCFHSARPISSWTEELCASGERRLLQGCSMPEYTGTI